MQKSEQYIPRGHESKDMLQGKSRRGDNGVKMTDIAGYRSKGVGITVVALEFPYERTPVSQ